MSAPRPEGMREERVKGIGLRLEAAKRAYDALDLAPGVPDNGEWLAVFGALRDADEMLAELVRLRADGATLTTKVDALHDALTTLAGEYETALRTLRTVEQRADEALAAHAASFGALSTLSAALFDGEVDDYAALAEKIIARVKQAEADGATLRERVRKLSSPIRQYMDLVEIRYLCSWCSECWQGTSTHPDNGCLWSEVHREDVGG